MVLDGTGKLKELPGYISSPCVSLCNLEEGFCTGCGRSKEQIIRWRRYSDEQRESIMKDLGSQVR